MSIGQYAVGEYAVGEEAVAAAPPAGGLAWLQNSNQIVGGNMLKNVAGQNITALLLDTDGVAVTTGTTTVYVTGDAGTQASMGTATHEGNGEWSIDVTQAECNYDDIGFTWVNTGAVTVHQHVFTDQAYEQIGVAGIGLTNLGASGNNWNVGKTGYSLTATTGLGNQTSDITGSLSGSVGSVMGHTPQTGDTYALANGATGFVAIDTVVDTINSNVGTAGAGLTAINLPNQTMDITGNLSGSVGSVTAEVTADVTKISGSTAAADNLEASASTIIVGSATAVTLTTTTMSADGFTEATDDHYNGRIIIWTSGVLQNQATDITGYDGASQTFTFTQVTEAPSNDDTFVIV
jgi:hypothetical protein